MTARSVLRRPRTWIIAVPVLVLLVAVVGPFVYINFVQDDPPERLTLSDTPSTVATTGRTTGETLGATAGTLDGTWSISDATVGYRVKEVLFGQDTEATGRTSAVSGDLVIDGTTITTAAFDVDLTTIESDETRRDNQFKGRIMDTATFPTATFELTEPIALEAMPADLEQKTVAVTGDFTIHGVTKSVTFDLTARRNGSTIEVNGAIPVAFADYDIPDASFGPATVQDKGEIEFLITFSPG